MSDEYRDPSGNTEAFRVFAQQPDPAAAPTASRLPLLIGAVAAAVVVVVLVAWLALG
nr:hypothetical protein [Micromonospora sp. DSM 115978]